MFLGSRLQNIDKGCFGSVPEHLLRGEERKARAVTHPSEELSKPCRKLQNLDGSDWLFSAGGKDLGLYLLY